MRFRNWPWSQSAYVLAIRRMALTEMHMMKICGFRKCRRDGACTAIILGYENGELVKAEEDQARAMPLPHDFAPHCRLRLSPEERRAFDRRCEQLQAFFKEHPDVPVRVKDRAIRAGNWARL